MALDFNGTNQEVDTADIDITDCISITAWINLDTYGEDVGGVLYGRIVSKYDGAYAYDFHTQEAAGVNCLVFRFAGGNFNSDGGCLSLATDLFVAVTYDNLNVRFYVNAVAKGALANSTALSVNNANVLLGNLSGFARHLNGRMWDARIYGGSSVLTPTQLKILFESRGADNIVDNLAARWLMNEKSDGETATVASSVIDISGNGNHGSPANSPIYRAAPVRLVRPLVTKTIFA